jgi:glutaredoxin
MGRPAQKLVQNSAVGLCILLALGSACLIFFPSSPLSTKLVEAMKQAPPYHFAEDPGEGFVVYYPIHTRDKQTLYVVELSKVPPGQRDTVGRLVLAEGHDPTELANEPRVTLYSTSWCGYCKRTTRLLDELGVPFIHKDIERTQALSDELQAASGGLQIPFLLIDGQPIRGYDKERIAALLKK